MSAPPSAPLNAWCDISLDVVARNLDVTLSLLPEGAAFCAVVKSDAYGHGISRIVPLLMEQGVHCIGITSNAEANAVRRAGFSGRLIRLRGATLAELEAARADGVQEQVGSLWAAHQLRDLAGGTKGAAEAAGVHLALNAGGMSRDGLDISTPQGRQECAEILEIIAPRLVGISTHFASNVPDALARSDALFQEQVAWVCATGGLKRSGLLIHAGSTLTLLSGQRIESDMYRCGAILYGFLRPGLGFRPSMALRASVAHVGCYPKGATVGYDCDTRLEDERRLACLSIGYAAGYGRQAQDRGAVLIRGQYAPVLGKVSMNSIVADVTEIPEAQVGDIATVFGSDGAAQVPATTATEQFQTIVPDLFADWGMRNPRLYR